MMNRKEFYEYVKDNVKEYLPESYKDAEIKLQEVEKNNGLKLTGITIPNGDQRIVPTVYLDSLYQEYIHGKDVDSCVGDVADMRIEAQGKAEFFDMGVPDILDYEKMKNKLQVRICDKEWNTDRLADKVVTEHGDFAAYYAVNLEENGEGISSIPVTVSLMNEWGVSVEQIQADEYINRIQRFGHWKDTGIRIRGHAVWNFTVMFLKMWNSFRPTEEDYSPFRPHVHHPDEFGSDGIIQPYADSPLDDENIGENVYLEILSQAEDYVYIFTPYLIIDNEMKTSLELAAKRGVDVRIVTPAIPDKKTIFRLTRSYYRPLMKAGVRIYEYTPGFMHAKSYLSDDKIGVVGTINMDYRSLFLHFECGTLLIGCQALYDLKKDCEAVFGVSREMHQEDCRRGFFGVLADSLLRVLSPLL